MSHFGMILSFHLPTTSVSLRSSYILSCRKYGVNSKVALQNLRTLELFIEHSECS